MKLEDQLKQMMIEKCGSVRAFSIASDISNSTVDSVLKRGIQNSGVGTVLKIFQFLGVDEKTLVSDRIIMVGEEAEKSPAPSEDSAGEKQLIDREKAEVFLTSLGFIKPGQDLRDEDLLFLDNAISLLEAWFKQRSQGV